MVRYGGVEIGGKVMEGKRIVLGICGGEGCWFV